MDRGASRTAILVCEGRAVADGRYAVGTFSDPVAVELLDPPERAVVQAARGSGTGAHPLAVELARRVAVTMVPRTIAIDDALREAALPQVVILGAGLDARPWRLAELAGSGVFEVDHPASQADKQRRIGNRPPVGRHAYVPVDLALDPLRPALLAAGFDPDTPSAWVWEGVVPYLTKGQVASVVRQVSALCAANSVFVVNYQEASPLVGLARHLLRLVWRIARQDDPLRAEPWRSLWRPAEIGALLAVHGFAVTTDTDLRSLSAGLDLPDGNDASLRNSRVLLARRDG